MGRKLNLVGRVFSRLTVLKEHASKSADGRMLWECACSCGTWCVVRAGCLTAGKTTSCGCKNSENKTGNAYNTTHGMTSTTTWKTWESMRARCERTSDASYVNYGGRGITVCAEWHNFETFLADMGARPSGMSLDRVDNAGDYRKENCRWATCKEQSNNRRSNHLLTHQGSTMTVSEWADKVGISAYTLFTRLRRGQSVEQALSAPARRYLGSRAPVRQV